MIARLKALSLMSYELYKNYTGQEPKGELLPTELIEPSFIDIFQAGSSDIGDVSQIVPTVQLYGGGEVVGLPAHHWTTTAVTGTPIGHKAALYGGKVLAQVAYEISMKPELLDVFQEEFRHSKKDYHPVLPSGGPEIQR